MIEATLLPYGCALQQQLLAYPVDLLEDFWICQCSPLCLCTYDFCTLCYIRSLMEGFVDVVALLVQMQS